MGAWAHSSEVEAIIDGILQEVQTQAEIAFSTSGAASENASIKGLRARESILSEEEVCSLSATIDAQGGPKEIRL